MEENFDYNSCTPLNGINQYGDLFRPLWTFLNLNKEEKKSKKLKKKLKGTKICK